MKRKINLKRNSLMNLSKMMKITLKFQTRKSKIYKIIAEKEVIIPILTTHIMRIYNIICKLYHKNTEITPKIKMRII